MSLSSFEEKSQTEVDAIVNRLAATNSSLAACSFVSKRWHSRSRQQFFRRARLVDFDNLRSSGWSPTPNDVHSAGDSSDDHTKGGELWVTFIPQTLHRFKAVNYITSLTLDHFLITPLDFPILQRTFWDLTSSVKNLRLLCPSACPVSLLQFIAIFRDLRSATIHAPSWVKEDQCEDGKATPFGQFHGELCLSELDDASISFISFLGSFAAGASKVTISKCNLRDPRSFQAFLSSAKRTIRCLQVIVGEEGEVPDLSLKDCTALEHVFLSVKGPTASFPIISSLISSISSNDFKSFTLKLQTTARRERDIVQTDLTDRISSLDAPLSRLGRLVAARNKKVSVVLLGQEPEFLAQGLIDFHEVGHIWAGEDMDEGRYLWSFTSPKRRATKRHPIRMFALFKRND